LGENESGEPMETKCDSSDEIVRECKATAEGTYLKGPTSVKDHDASAVSMENQHEALEKISESYDCEPEKFTISCDPGQRIIPLNDSQAGPARKHKQSMRTLGAAHLRINPYINIDCLFAR
jgi:hypothetical protein